MGQPGNPGKKCVGVYGGGVGVGGCQISMEREWEGMEVRGAACLV